MERHEIPGKTHTERWQTTLESVSEGYFQMLGVPLIRGRLFSEDGCFNHGCIDIRCRDCSHSARRPSRVPAACPPRGTNRSTRGSPLRVMLPTLAGFARSTNWQHPRFTARLVGFPSI